MTGKTKEQFRRWLNSKAGVRIGATWDLLTWPFVLAFFMIEAAIKEGMRYKPDVMDIYVDFWAAWFTPLK